ncbi:hypothetical protein M9H77_17392 [Catharanthus roseus]|uniref:Uncharacterized protein n=1 Tax=Catharanthus roseus TaxID=4058 RepID=A0ACC0B4I3_CATRO|nr:hypothetical protein M9H77_17392 [Catharanthus roseus]
MFLYLFSVANRDIVIYKKRIGVVLHIAVVLSNRFIVVGKQNLVIHRSVRGLYCTWLVPRTRALSDDVDVSNSREWIHLKKDVDRGGDIGVRLFGNRTIVWCLASIDYEMQELDSDDLVLGSGLCPWSLTVALYVSLNLGQTKARLELVVKFCFLLCREILLIIGPELGSRFGTHSLVPRGTQIPYSATVDLVTGLGVSQVVSGHLRPVARGVELGVSIEEGPSKAESDARMVLEPEEVAPVDTEGTGDLAANGFPLLVSPVCMPTGDGKGCYVRDGVGSDAGVARGWGDTIRDSVDRACVELESRPGGSGSRHPQVEQLEPIRENKPRPEQATHTFYGEVEQEMKVELFLKQLNDIYDTLKYKDALRLIHTDENKTQQFVKGLRVELQRGLAPLPPKGFAAAVEAATRTEMVDQASIQTKVAIGSAATPYKRHVKEQFPEIQQVPSETSKKKGRPSAIRGAIEGSSDKSQVKEKVYELDGLPVDTKADIVEGMIQIFSQPARALIDPGASILSQMAFLFINTYETPIPTTVTVLTAEGVAQLVYVDTVSCSTVGFGRLVKSREGLETKVGPEADLCLACIDYETPELDSEDLVLGFRLCPWSPTAALHVSLNSGVEVALMCLDLLRLPSYARNPHVGLSISIVKITKENVFLEYCMNCFRETASSLFQRNH